MPIKCSIHSRLVWDKRTKNGSKLNKFRSHFVINLQLLFCCHLRTEICFIKNWAASSYFKPKSSNRNWQKVPPISIWLLIWSSLCSNFCCSHFHNCFHQLKLLNNNKVLRHKFLKKLMSNRCLLSFKIMNVENNWTGASVLVKKADIPTSWNVISSHVVYNLKVEGKDKMHLKVCIPLIEIGLKWNTRWEKILQPPNLMCYVYRSVSSPFYSSVLNAWAEKAHIYGAALFGEKYL